MIRYNCLAIDRLLLSIVIMILVWNIHSTKSKLHHLFTLSFTCFNINDSNYFLVTEVNVLIYISITFNDSKW